MTILSVSARTFPSAYVYAFKRQTPKGERKRETYRQEEIDRGRDRNREKERVREGGGESRRNGKTK